MIILGFDIGGTKCAVVTATWDGEAVTLLKKKRCKTDLSVKPEVMISRLIEMADEITEGKPDAIGISCGGPLDSEKGVILSPPNLPGWDRVEIVRLLSEYYGVTAKLQNDADASAVAEWKFGAGKGTDNMIFLTFGTGLGAGLVLGGRLYRGANGNAGEAGHIRLSENGPEGYGKAGSFEGFCSGGGIRRLGLEVAERKINEGIVPLYMKNCAENVSAKSIADAARSGDETAKEVYRICGENLGKGLSVLIDILNPEMIVIGSIFERAYDLLWEHTERVIEKEALPMSRKCCRIVPAKLGDEIGDYAAIGAALS